MRRSTYPFIGARWSDPGADGALVRADAVTDMQRVTPHGWLVQSASQGGIEYAVTSNGSTTCTCQDATRHGHICKHGYAVLLLRHLRRDVNKPRCRHAYHYVHGEGYAVVRTQGTVEFWPGGRARSLTCDREDVTLGPVVSPAVWR
jgi:hypothetical protein